MFKLIRTLSYPNLNEAFFKQALKIKRRKIFMEQKLEDSFFINQDSNEIPKEANLSSKQEFNSEYDIGVNDAKKNMTYLCMSYFCLALILKNKKIMGNEHTNENFNIKKAAVQGSTVSNFFGGKAFFRKINIFFYSHIKQRNISV